jgi:thiol:disulfide interchange protein DsbC
MHLLNRLAIAFSLAFAASAAQAGEAEIKKTIETQFVGSKVQSVTKTPYSGLYEVVLEGAQVAYVDEKVNYLFMGSIMDVKNQRNLTEERVQKLTAIKFDTLPLELAIKVVKGNGSRKIAVFSDADCPYCKKFEEELKNVNNITVYNFLYPIDSLHPQAGMKSKQIWCAPDKVKAWEDYMLRGVLPKNDGNCDNPLAKTAELGRKHNIQGTPAIVFSDGRRVPGMIPAPKLEQMLEAAGATVSGKNGK